MNANVAADWRADLDASRDLSDLDKQGFGFLLSWFESYRMRKGLRADRPAAVLFWREQVVVKPRKQWQLDRWAEAGWERSGIKDQRLMILRGRIRLSGISSNQQSTIRLLVAIFHFFAPSRLRVRPSNRCRVNQGNQELVHHAKTRRDSCLPGPRPS